MWTFAPAAVVAAELFPEARNAAFKLTIDFDGDIGIRTSSPQIARHYAPEAHVKKTVITVVNFPPRQIGPFISQVLTLGVPGEDGEVVLLHPSLAVPNDGRMFLRAERPAIQGPDLLAGTRAGPAYW